jgi:Fic family protein
MRKTGSYELVHGREHFIPYRLPVDNPPLIITAEMQALIAQTEVEMARLNTLAMRLPDQKRFIRSYIMKEALLSSSIEGIWTTLIEVFSQELDAPIIEMNKETQLVVNYVRALDNALVTLDHAKGVVVPEMLLAAHEALFAGTDAERVTPRLYRTRSVRIGAFVPAPAHAIERLMSELEQYMNSDNGLPALVKIGLIHAQFEMIHPFFDGNGRIGRLLIVVLLVKYGLLTQPILYPSYYLSSARFDYYDGLAGFSRDGNVEGWISYFLKAMQVCVTDASSRVAIIQELEQELYSLIDSREQFELCRPVARLVVAALFVQPVIAGAELSRQIGATEGDVKSVLSVLIDSGYVRLANAASESSYYYFKRYLDVL